MMLQILQNIKSGDLSLDTVPTPNLIPGSVLIKTNASLISAGTEKMIIDLAQKSYIGKAQARPDLVKQVIIKAKKEGWLNTFNNVMSKMEKPLPLGYSAAGVIEGLDEWMIDFKIGDRIAIAGAGYANHAEINVAPKNLCARIPDNVSFEEAAYTTVASIALQGVRLANPELGEFTVVSGLGLIGLITVQLLKANGCRVIGLDYDQGKIDLALRLGMDEGFNLSSGVPVKIIERFTGGRLADHTIITAAAKSNQPIELAGEITRRKGSVIVVGAVGMNIPRDLYYKKEIDIKISMSYGPGRYDPTYEEGGIDYPYDYVRWTEQRNMEAVLNLMSQGKLNVRDLTTHYIPFEKALDAYAMIKEGKESYVGIILQYDTNKQHENKIILKKNIENKTSDKINISFVGAGNYASIQLLPFLRKQHNVNLKGLVTSTGPNSKQKGEKFGFEFCSTDYNSLIENQDINSIFIATRHSTHADLTLKALKAGKNVFVEKPVVVNKNQLDELICLYQELKAAPVLMVGLNRRFAPMTRWIKEEFKDTAPMHMIYRVNSGHIPTSSWLHNPEEGGGMMIGEMCHFIDLMMFICGETPVSVIAESLQLSNSNIADSDNVSMTVKFNKGSIGVLNYNTIGDKSFSKERLEIYSGGKVGVLDDFRRAEVIGKGKKKSANQDKGQAEQIKQTVEMFKKNQSPIPFNELVNVMLVIFGAQESLRSGEKVRIDPYLSA